MKSNPFLFIFGCIAWFGLVLFPWAFGLILSGKNIIAYVAIHTPIASPSITIWAGLSLILIGFIHMLPIGMLMEDNPEDSFC